MSVQWIARGGADAALARASEFPTGCRGAQLFTGPEFSARGAALTADHGRVSARILLRDDLGSAFRVGSDGGEGYGRGRLRGPDVTAPFFGVRRRMEVEDDPLRAAFDYVPLLRPGDRFSHETAALAWGAPLPRDPRELHVAAASGGQPRSRGVVGHRSEASVAVRSGLPVSDPARTFLELAPSLALDDLVAVGDHLVLRPHRGDPADPRPWVTLDELRAAASAFTGRGACRARDAVGLLRVGSESRRETFLRLLVLRAGYPEPELNVEIYDREGIFIGRFDLVWRSLRILLEYDGDQHRTSREQYEKDIRRFDHATEDGWTVIRVRSRGLRYPAETVARLSRAFARAS